MNELNKYLYEALDRLANDDLMSEKGEREIRRSNAISKACESIVTTAKLQLQIKQLAEKQNTTIKAIEHELGLYNEKRN